MNTCEHFDDLPEEGSMKQQLDFSIPPLIQASQDAFRRKLPELLETHYRQWVAFHGDTQIGIANSGNGLYEQCIALGFKPGEFVVRCVVPETPQIIDKEELLGA